MSVAPPVLPARTARTPSPPLPRPQLPRPPSTETPTGAEIGDGIYKVGVDIQPGEYRGTVSDGNGYWARLDRNQEILDNDLVTKTGASMYLRVRATDAYVEISGATFHKVS